MGKLVQSATFNAAGLGIAAVGMALGPAGPAQAAHTPADHVLLQGGDPWHITPGNGTMFSGTNLNSAQLSANSIPFTCSPGAASVKGRVSGNGAPYSPPNAVPLGSISDANFGLNGGCQLLGASISAMRTPGAAPFQFNGRSYVSNATSRKAVGSITNISASINTRPGAPLSCHLRVSNINGGSPLPGSFYDTPYISPNGVSYGPNVFVVNPGHAQALRVKSVHGDATCMAVLQSGDPAFFSGVFDAHSPNGAALSVSAS